MFIALVERVQTICIPFHSHSPVVTKYAVPFVFVTGYDAAMIPAEFADIERVEKPIRPRRFLAAVLKMVQFTAR